MKLNETCANLTVFLLICNVSYEGIMFFVLFQPENVKENWTSLAEKNSRPGPRSLLYLRLEYGSLILSFHENTLIL